MEMEWFTQAEVTDYFMQEMQIQDCTIINYIWQSVIYSDHEINQTGFLWEEI